MASRQGKKQRPVKRRATGRKRTKKVNLDKNKVRLLCGIIFLVCCVCIAFNIVIQSAGEKQKAEQKTVIAKTQVEEPKTAQKKETAAQKKVEPSQSQKVQNPVKQNSAAKAESKTESSNKSADKASNKTVSKTENTKKSETSTKAEQPKKMESSKTAPLPEKKATVSSEQKKNLPQVQQTKTKESQKSPFLIPPAQNNATLVFIIDDAGLNVEYTKKYATLPFPITIAVLPKLAHSKDCAYIVRSNGKELILHQPMQSINHNLDPGPGKISVDMSFAEISSIVNENLAEIGPGVKGLNNHEGSEVTQDVLRIGAVLDVCQQNGIYFLDSRTTANTRAPQAALERDMKIYEKSGPYIDNVVSRQAMLAEIYKSFEVANKKGCAIVIGHVDKSVNILPDLLLEMYPYIKAAGYRFATPSTLR